ncbi:MAG: cytochrome c oxidase subunit II [Acidobacteria bacterium]|nr:cytochrome c oxidase subunit II [Acidobacteriota bacterium]MCB9397713.1 cytochrome c oxidase subunit II [Acidobacteriota bacterium]
MPIDVSGISEIGTRVDQVQMALIWLMAFCFIACNAVLIYFMLRYRRKSANQPTADLRGSHFIETVWTLIPTIVVIIIFFYGINVWSDMRTPPEDSYQINVKARQWSWSFEYPDGRVEATEMVVPVDTPIKLNMVSEDVLHSFFLPHFRVKEDVVPSQYTYLWFEAKKTGDYHIFCTEYCGKDHSAMLGNLKVVDEEAWQRWLRNEPEPGQAPLSPEQRGEKLWEKWGCKGCHSTDGSVVLGPSFKGIYGKEEHFESGESLVIDDNYIRESIYSPQAKIVKGFTNQLMPSFQGQLKEDDISDVIAFIKSLQ